MKKLLIVSLISIVTVLSITAQTDNKEKKPVAAAKIIPSPGQPGVPVQVEAVLKPGMMVPEYEVPSLENPNVKYSKKGMMGKIYMIDFWATWCGPCVAEMKVLHEAYEKFKSKGLEIISFSADTKAEDITPFRKNKWAMPWKHTFFGRGKECLYPKIKEDFGIKFIPSPFLIGADGKILAMGEDLRGEKLLETLGKYFK